MWDSEVTNYRTDMHIANAASKVMWSCNATSNFNEHEGGGEVQISTRAQML